MKTIILSAGRGSRLQGLTAERPKCLLDISGRSLLEWQVRALEAAGVAEIVVVTGFGASHVEDALQAMERGGVAPGTQSFAVLDSAIRTSSGSFAAPLLGRMRGALRREAPASTLGGEYLVRHDASYTSFGLSRLDWRTERGEPLLSLSGVQGSFLPYFCW